MPVKLTTLLLWAGAAGIVVFWGCALQATQAAKPVVAAAQPVQANAQALAKALGAVALPPAACSDAVPAAMR